MELLPLLSLIVSALSALMVLYGKITADVREKARNEANERLLLAYQEERRREFDDFKRETKDKLNGLPGDVKVHHKVLGEIVGRLAVLESDVKGLLRGK